MDAPGVPVVEGLGGFSGPSATTSSDAKQLEAPLLGGPYVSVRSFNNEEDVVETVFRVRRRPDVRKTRLTLAAFFESGNESWIDLRGWLATGGLALFTCLCGFADVPEVLFPVMDTTSTTTIAAAPTATTAMSQCPEPVMPSHQPRVGLRSW